MSSKKYISEEISNQIVKLYQDGYGTGYILLDFWGCIGQQYRSFLS